MSKPNASPLKAVDCTPLLPCAHQPGQQVLVCITGHTNLLGNVCAVTFTDGGLTLYDVWVADPNGDPTLISKVSSWRVAPVPETYQGAPAPCGIKS